MNNSDSSSAQDFDFLIGSWRVLNRRLTERLKNCDTWEEFEATLSVRPILGGLGNVDQFRTTLNGVEFEGMTLRLFNPATREWSLYWADSARAELQPPLVGRFQEGRGEFFSRETHNDIPILARFVWDDITENSARWEQAFSTDDGATWESNWIMEFTRE